MKISSIPHEILVRYDENGRFQGAHVANLKTIYGDAGEVVHREMEPPRPVARAEDPAFRDVLSAVLTDALADHAVMKQRVYELDNRKDASPVTPNPAPANADVRPWLLLGAITLPAYAYIVVHIFGMAS